MSSPSPASSRGEHLSHTLSAEQVLRRLGVDPESGLTADEARRRAEVWGPNRIPESRRRGPFRMFLDQFTDFMILVLIAAAVVSGVIGDITDTVVILIIVFLNAVIGFIQEYRAERAIAALRRLAAPTTRVLREGRAAVVPSEKLVPGDVVLLEAGNVAPADLRLLEAVRLKTDESALTGESEAVEKLTESLTDAELPLGDRKNMAYKATRVTTGRGKGVVVATGGDTELGKIASLMEKQEEVKTPLQKRLARFGSNLALAVLAICVILFAVGVLRGEPVLLMLLTAISLAVAAIPEALPAVVTVSLAIGARKMVRKNALIRRLSAVETLGSVTYICSDKTGTLTLNKMRVEEAYADDRALREIAPDAVRGEPWDLLFRAAALSNDGRLGANGEILGDPTEVALYQAARDAGYAKEVLEKGAPRLGELPFDSERARMTTLHRDGDAVVSFTKGAPESIIARCRDRLTSRGPAPLDPDAALRAMERMAADGLRVLALAFRRFSAMPETLDPEALERELTFLGLVGLMDPPRDEARRAVSLCRSAGITPVMITGDHPATARAIASRLGIAESGAEVITGRELAGLSPREFEEKVEQIRVYARATPEQKIRIVKALQKNGEFVAMTGDGVNDAPALRSADIGVAMGITGTDVAKEAGHMILLDDNFGTIVAAVREGRAIFDNIRKFIRYTMTSNSGEIWTIFLAPFLGLPIPLLPIHILWINLVTDGLPGLALAAEPEEKGIMERPPRPPNESIFAHGMWQQIIWVGLLMGGVCLFSQAYAIRTGLAHWQTIVFTVLTLSQMGHALAIRSERDSLFTQGIASNRPLLGAILLTFLLQLATIYVPFLNPIFKTEPLNAGELIFSLVLSCVVFIAVEIEKALIRQGLIYRGSE